MSPGYIILLMYLVFGVLVLLSREGTVLWKGVCDSRKSVPARVVYLVLTIGFVLFWLPTLLIAQLDARQVKM